MRREALLRERDQLESQRRRSVPPQGADPHPAFSTRGKAGRNHLNEEIAPLLPTRIGERYSQTISN
jgi:hypothetical protein